MKTLEVHIESCEFSRALQYRLTFQGRVETDLSEEATNPIFEEATRQVPFAVIKDGKEWLFVDLRAVVDGQEIVVASETVEIEPGKDAKELKISFDSSKVDTKEVADDQDNVIENAVNAMLPAERPQDIMGAMKLSYKLVKLSVLSAVASAKGVTGVTISGEFIGSKENIEDIRLKVKDEHGSLLGANKLQYRSPSAVFISFGSSRIGDSLSLSISEFDNVHVVPISINKPMVVRIVLTYGSVLMLSYAFQRVNIETPLAFVHDLSLYEVSSSSSGADLGLPPKLLPSSVYGDDNDGSLTFVHLEDPKNLFGNSRAVTEICGGVVDMKSIIDIRDNNVSLEPSMGDEASAINTTLLQSLYKGPTSGCYIFNTNPHVHENTAGKNKGAVNSAYNRLHERSVTMDTKVIKTVTPLFMGMIPVVNEHSNTDSFPTFPIELYVSVLNVHVGNITKKYPKPLASSGAAPAAEETADQSSPEEAVEKDNAGTAEGEQGGESTAAINGPFTSGTSTARVIGGGLIKEISRENSHDGNFVSMFEGQLSVDNDVEGESTKSLIKVRVYSSLVPNSHIRRYHAEEPPPMEKPLEETKSEEVMPLPPLKEVPAEEDNDPYAFGDHVNSSDVAAGKRDTAAAHAIADLFRHELAEKQRIIEALMLECKEKDAGIQLCGKDIKYLRDDNFATKMRLKELENILHNKIQLENDSMEMSETLLANLQMGNINNNQLANISRGALLGVIQKMAVHFQRQSEEKNEYKRLVADGQSARKQYNELMSKYANLEDAHMQQSKHLSKFKRDLGRIDTFKQTIQMQEKVISKMQLLIESRLQAAKNENRMKGDGILDQLLANLDYTVTKNKIEREVVSSTTEGLQADLERKIEELKEAYRVIEELNNRVWDLESAPPQVQYVQAPEGEGFSARSAPLPDSASMQEPISISERDQYEAEIQSKDYRIKALEEQMTSLATDFSKEIARLRTKLFEFELVAALGFDDQVDADEFNHLYNATGPGLNAVKFLKESGGLSDSEGELPPGTQLLSASNSSDMLLSADMQSMNASLLQSAKVNKYVNIDNYDE